MSFKENVSSFKKVNPGQFKKLVIGVQDQHRRSLSCKGLRVQPGSNLIEQNNPIVLVLLHFACDWSCHSLNQSDANLNQSRLGRPRFPALWQCGCFTLSTHCHLRISSFFLICCCDNFGFGFTTLDRKALQMFN